MANALGVDVGQRAEQLVNVQLHLEDWHGGLHFVEEPRCTVDSLGDVFLNQVEIDFILLSRLLAGTCER